MFSSELLWSEDLPQPPADMNLQLSLTLKGTSQNILGQGKTTTSLPPSDSFCIAMATEGPRVRGEDKKIPRGEHKVICAPLTTILTKHDLGWMDDSTIVTPPSDM
ncbi:unnamed protein product [Arctogadus glacialis]